MDNNHKTMFALLRVALWGAEFDLSLLPASDAAWEQLFLTSKAQGVSAILFDGIMEIMRRTDDKLLGMSRKFKMRWLSAVDSIERRYARQQSVAAKIASLCAEQGIEAVTFKGLSLSRYYPVPSHRQCGDIDIYALDGRGEQLDDALVAAGGVMLHKQPKHSELSLGGVMVEGHRYFVHRYFSPRAKWLNSVLEQSVVGGQPMFECGGLYGSTPQFDTLFVLYHAANHFMLEGISLRHAMDWCYVVKNTQGNIGKVADIGLERFSALLCRIGRDCLGFDFEESLCRCDDAIYKRVLDDIAGSDVGKVNDKVGFVKLLWRKCCRFTSRRWVYSLVDNSFFMGVLNSLWGHIVQPKNLIRGNK